MDLFGQVISVCLSEKAGTDILDRKDGVNGVAGRADPGILHFGVYEFEPGAGELRKHGVRLKLEGQPVAVLAMLLEHPGDLITREELQKRLWSAGTFVDFEHSLNAAVRRLRAALNDSADTPRYIETQARRGYRFIAPVGMASAAAPVVPGKTPSGTPPRRFPRWPVVALMALGLAAWGWRELLHLGSGPAPGGAIRSIAVLPLVNLSGDPSQEYFADGMTEALITDLAQVGSLRVISRTSVMRYKQTHKPLPEIARDLGVDGIVEGSVARSGNRVRISSQLIRASSDQHLWARSYEREVRDVLALEGEVAHAIAAEVRAAITPQQLSRLESAPPVNPEAYQLYLRGLFHWNQYSPAGIRAAIDYFRQAVQTDPGFAPAYAGLAIAYDMSSVIGSSFAPGETFPLARAAATKALELDPLLSDAHTALAIEKSDYELDRTGAEKEFLRAIELNPNSSLARRHYAGSYLKCMGRYQDAVAQAKKAVELDPFSLPANGFLALMYGFAGDDEHSIEQYRHLLELDPNNGRTHLLFAMNLARLGRYRESIDEFEKGEILVGTPPEQAASHAVAMRRAARSGRASDYWQGYLELGLEALGQAGQQWFGPTDIAEAYAQLGNKDKAFGWLEKAYRESEGIPLSALNCDPGFRNLHGDPRFAALLRRLNLRE